MPDVVIAGYGPAGAAAAIAAHPGLYAAGAVSLAWGHLIEHGGGLTDAMVFGRIAGAEVACRAAQATTSRVAEA